MKTDEKIRVLARVLRFVVRLCEKAGKDRWWTPMKKEDETLLDAISRGDL